MSDPYESARDAERFQRYATEDMKREIAEREADPMRTRFWWNEESFALHIRSENEMSVAIRGVDQRFGRNEDGCELDPISLFSAGPWEIVDVDDAGYVWDIEGPIATIDEAKARAIARDAGRDDDAADR